MATSSSADQRPKAAQPAETVDLFLDGRVTVHQPKRGFRAGLDSVMLAAAITARPRDRVCDLGAGVGTASLCLAARVPGLHIAAVEIDEDLAAMARANAARNASASSFDVIVANVLKRPRILERQSFNHVLTNPPFHDAARGTRAPAAAKARATSAPMRELFGWLRLARALVHGQGTVTAILPPAQVTVALGALSPEGLGVEIIPLWPKADAPAKRVIIRTRMNSKAPLIIAPGLVLHLDTGAPSPAAQAVLRHGRGLTT